MQVEAGGIDIALNWVASAIDQSRGQGEADDRLGALVQGARSRLFRGARLDDHGL